MTTQNTAESYIKPEDVSLQEAQNVLDFLNAARSAEEIAQAVEIPDERDVGIGVAQRILDRRQVLGGFSNLQQVADVPQVGPERFTEIVVTLGSRQTGGQTMLIEISSYDYGYSGSKKGDSPYINAHGADGKAAYLKFRDDSEPIPDGIAMGDPGRFTAFYPRSACCEIIDLLRNEKPVYFVWANETTYYIGTSSEAVGEGEVS